MGPSIGGVSATTQAVAGLKRTSDSLGTESRRQGAGSRAGKKIPDYSVIADARHRRSLKLDRSEVRILSQRRTIR